MSEHRVATRYAKALFQLAEELGHTDAVQRDLAGLRALIEGHAELAAFVTDPSPTPRAQLSALEALFRSRVHELVFRTLEFLVDRRRLPILSDLCAAFETLYRDARHLVTAQLVSATPLQPAQLEALRRKLEAKYHKQVEMKAETDPALLGGFVVRVQDAVHDLSVRGQLAALRTTLVHA